MGSEVAFLCCGSSLLVEFTPLCRSVRLYSYVPLSVVGLGEPRRHPRRSMNIAHREDRSYHRPPCLFSHCTHHSFPTGGPWLLGSIGSRRMASVCICKLNFTPCNLLPAAKLFLSVVGRGCNLYVSCQGHTQTLTLLSHASNRTSL